jgi:hypothetical protein
MQVAGAEVVDEFAGQLDVGGLTRSYRKARQGRRHFEGMLDESAFVAR